MSNREENNIPIFPQKVVKMTCWLEAISVSKLNTCQIVNRMYDMTANLSPCI